MEFIKKLFLILIGTISLSLGIIGIFLPLLPTTPFLLLAGICYMRSSKRLYDWLMNHKVFSSYIYNYITYRAIKRTTKIATVVILWFSLIISIIIVDNLHIKIILIAIGVGVTTHIIRLNTLKL